MKLNTGAVYNVFENYSGMNSEKDHINGWSFVAQGDQEIQRIQGIENH